MVVSHKKKQYRHRSAVCRSAEMKMMEIKEKSHVKNKRLPEYNTREWEKILLFEKAFARICTVLHRAADIVSAMHRGGFIIMHVQPTQCIWYRRTIVLKNNNNKRKKVTFYNHIMRRCQQDIMFIRTITHFAERSITILMYTNNHCSFALGYTTEVVMNNSGNAVSTSIFRTRERRHVRSASPNSGEILSSRSADNIQRNSKLNIRTLRSMNRDKSSAAVHFLFTITIGIQSLESGNRKPQCFLTVSLFSPRLLVFTPPFTKRTMNSSEMQCDEFPSVNLSPTALTFSSANVTVVS